MYSFGVIMDPIEDINPKEDSTFAIITALQKNHNIDVMNYFITFLGIMIGHRGASLLSFIH